ncbi:MAG: hypothetical protein AABM67_04810 [Acidobacteriota bacterium]
MPTRFKWSLVSDERLLDTRICDLPIRIKGSFLEPHIKRLYSELNNRGIRFKPHVWLSAEWFTPDGVPGFAIPFYLAHPRLMKLERKFMREVEGGTDIECMRILRHEAGHALDNAFRLHFKRRWIRMFGSFTQKYPPSYKPKPNSRRYVLNLDAWYAQAHPAEDFAETFAVWLQPRSNWRRRYRGWPALRKLEYVDELLNEVAGARPRNRVRRKIERLPEIRITLREHYERKRKQYAFEWPAYLDNDLRRIFSNEPRHRARETAVSFLRRIGPEVQQLVSEGTGVHGYAIDHVMELMIERAAQLKLRIVGREEQIKRHLMVMLTVQTMNVVHSGYFRIAL